MRGGLLDLIGVWVLGKERGREIEKEREGYGSCSVCWAKSRDGPTLIPKGEIGRASCRERVSSPV